MKAYQFIDKINTLDWLKGILKDYQAHIKLIEGEMDYYTVERIVYSCRGPGSFCVNPHRPIPATFILEGLKAEVAVIQKEIADLEHQLNGVIVDL